ncbi:hypothetical protein [Dokdonella sp.]|uniref:hypothetical protein n=1 Tax=Dokdonella sp. TaxID=2291710 RepID=UPI003C4E954E
MSDLDRLKELLLADERESLLGAEQRLAELERRNRQLAEQLPGLVRAAPHKPMTQALASPVAAALGSAVHENRSSIVDALFPVIGPIIRKAIAEALRGLMSDLNKVLEYGFSPRGIRWRLEAWRSGVPFAQIVLKHSLRYHVDHIFLIERDSGLVLHRASSPGLPDLDADAIAGMLTAIGQFVRDSVASDGSDSLEAARVGDHVLWILDGPRASLACFISGIPPDSLRNVLADRLEQIHATYVDSNDPPSAASELQASTWQAQLDPQELMAASAALAERDDAAGQSTSRWPLLAIVLLILAGLVWYFARIERWDARVGQVRSTLLSHPGFLLTGIESDPWNSLVVHGLLDAEADPVSARIGDVDLGEVKAQWVIDSYLSTADPILEKRVARLTELPAGVQVSVKDGVLRLAGSASNDWIAANRTRVAWIAGVQSVDWQVSATTDAMQAAREQLVALAARLSTLEVSFVREVEPTAEGQAQLGEMAALLMDAQKLAVIAGQSVKVHVMGYNDAPGSETINAKLRDQRAQWLRDRLLESGVPDTWFRDSANAESIERDEDFRGARVRLDIEAGSP